MGEHGDLAAFDELLCRLDGSPIEQRQALVDAWVARQLFSPLVGAGEALIWYAGAGDRVVLRGDMLGERSAVLQRVAGARLWFDRRRYEPDARLDYHVLVDGRDVGDPRNPRPAPSRYGPRAELRMPLFYDDELWRPRSGAARGTLSEYTLDSALYPSSRVVTVYTPPGYDARLRYPCVVFHDGGDYLRYGGAATILDNLVLDRALRPCVAAFVDPSREHGRSVDYASNDAYVSFLCDELLPWLGARVSLAGGPASTATVGASLGGLIALYSALRRPDCFGLLVAQSAYAGYQGDALVELFRAGGPPDLRAHLVVGSYETEVGPPDRGAEADFVRANRALRAVLAARGYTLDYAEYHDGHAWGLWRARLGDGLRFVLGARPGAGS